ncbi:Uncharacterised protein [Rothia kristinae]|nr:Uncharacterised protein [Rothia kristinae]
MTKPASAKAPSNQEVSEHVDAKDTSHPGPGAPLNKAATPDPKKADTAKPAEVKDSQKSGAKSRENVEGKEA